MLQKRKLPGSALNQTPCMRGYRHSRMSGGECCMTGMQCTSHVAQLMVCAADCMHAGPQAPVLANSKVQNTRNPSDCEQEPLCLRTASFIDCKLQVMQVQSQGGVHTQAGSMQTQRTPAELPSWHKQHAASQTRHRSCERTNAECSKVYAAR